MATSNDSAEIVLTSFRHVENEFTFQVGYYDSDEVFQTVDLAGRTLVFQARAPDADGATTVIDSATDASTCAPLSGDTTYVQIVIPSALATGIEAGTFDCAVVDVTDAGTDGEILIASGKLIHKPQAVR